MLSKSTSASGSSEKSLSLPETLPSESSSLSSLSSLSSSSSSSSSIIFPFPLSSRIIPFPFLSTTGSSSEFSSSSSSSSSSSVLFSGSLLGTASEEELTVVGSSVSWSTVVVEVSLGFLLGR
ncbi:hypothetical protein MtrunA17_Chr7g0251851 [Medicago truncatula]|uniref:Uncharacterized protein n=1 Tax=Medicago truncatula TaxID=3880 RepID=A0A396H3N4_MEDTR|nr:hypothetical protein MtrunA17_Chr7g0251851 [Medicago truncatula]